MKKNLLITLGIAGALFIYGYLASNAGHDHGSHGHGNAEIEEDTDLSHRNDGHDHEH